MRLKASKKPVKRFYAVAKWYDLGTKQIVSKWVSDDIYMNCPIFSCCADCRKCWK